MENEKWNVECGMWKVESGKWKVESGKWKLEIGISKFCPLSFFRVILDTIPMYYEYYGVSQYQRLIRIKGI
jgi:hypothetical protein